MNTITVTGQDKDAIQKAVNECAAAGGGMVSVPAGVWNTGKIHMKSNIELHLCDGAELIFSDEPDDYLPVVFTRWEGTECYNYSPLIYARDCENVSVTGKGTLNGNGRKWWAWKLLQQQAAEELGDAAANGVPVEERVYGTKEAALRPSFIQFIGCKNVLLDGFTIKDGPQWTIHPVYCEDVVIRDVKVCTNGHNTDGLNPDSCRNVLIDGCTFSTGDDCVAINAGLNEDGWRVGRPCENIEIRNCIMSGGHGGIVVGSAISGSVKNVYAHDCKITDTMWGIRMKSMRGRGGCVDGVRFENIIIENCERDAVQITMFYESSTIMPHSDAPTEFKNISLKNIKASGAPNGIEIKGLPEKPLTSILLEDMEITADRAMTIQDVKTIVMKNVNVNKE